MLKKETPRFMELKEPMNIDTVEPILRGLTVG